MFRGRSLPWILTGIVAASWLGLLLDPMVGPLLLALLAAFTFTLSIVLGAMGLGMAGMVIHSGSVRLLSWIQRKARWPDE
jgi:hypothetical protein